MKRTLVVAGAIIAALTSAAPAWSQGSTVYTQSACISGRAGTGVAAPCPDASGVFYNPAGLVTHSSALGLGVTAIRTGNTFTYDYTGETLERDPAVTPVPHGFASFRIGENLAAGIGVWAPYGLGIEWPLEFEGRFVGYDNALRALFVQPTVSWQLAPGFSLGGGVDFVRGSVEINQRLDLATTQVTGQPFTFEALGIPRGTDFADARLQGDAWGTTWHIGLLSDITDWLSFGFRYMHSVRIPFEEGTATFAPVETGIVLPANNPLGVPGGTRIDDVLAQSFPFGEQGVRTEITFPNMAVWGVRVQPLPRLSVLADYQWTGWSTFREFPLEFEQLPDSPLFLDYRDASTYRLGADYLLTDALTLRGGFIYNTAASPDVTVTPLLPEAERNYITAGLGYRFGERMGVDLMYQHLTQADRRGRVRGRPTRALTAEDLNVGVYSSTANLLGLSLFYQFGPAR